MLLRPVATSTSVLASELALREQPMLSEKFGRGPHLDPEDPHGTLLVDATNGFNELGRKALFWTI